MCSSADVEALAAVVVLRLRQNENFVFFFKTSVAQFQY
jgi:hypothetical protein